MTVSSIIGFDGSSTMTTEEPSNDDNNNKNLKKARSWGKALRQHFRFARRNSSSSSKLQQKPLRRASLHGLDKNQDAFDRCRDQAGELESDFVSISESDNIMEEDKSSQVASEILQELELLRLISTVRHRRSNSPLKNNTVAATAEPLPGNKTTITSAAATEKPRSASGGATGTEVSSPSYSSAASSTTTSGTRTRRSMVLLFDRLKAASESLSSASAASSFSISSHTPTEEVWQGSSPTADTQDVQKNNKKDNASDIDGPDKDSDEDFWSSMLLNNDSQDIWGTLLQNVTRPDGGDDMFYSFSHDDDDDDTEEEEFFFEYYEDGSRTEDDFGNDKQKEHEKHQEFPEDENEWPKHQVSEGRLGMDPIQIQRERGCAQSVSTKSSTATESSNSLSSGSGSSNSSRNSISTVTTTSTATKSLSELLAEARRGRGFSLNRNPHKKHFVWNSWFVPQACGQGEVSAIGSHHNHCGSYPYHPQRHHSSTGSSIPSSLSSCSPQKDHTKLGKSNAMDSGSFSVSSSSFVLESNNNASRGDWQHHRTSNTSRCLEYM